MIDGPDSKLIDELLRRNEALTRAMSRCAIIDDVLNDCVLDKKSGNGLQYLPKGKMEPESEYKQRVSMTPWFPKTPSILNDRQGALFSSPPKLCGDSTDQLKEFEKCATSLKETVQLVAIKSAALAQRHGLCAVLIDKAPLPEDVLARDGVVSVEEKAKRKLDYPQLAIYELAQILDFDADSDGLLWVKTVETTSRRSGWNAPIEDVATVRIHGRLLTTSYEIVDKKTVKKLGEKAHGWTAVPIVFCAPQKGSDGIGRPSLLGSAQADVSATRLLSDVIWCLFIAGQPLLTLKTNRSDDELAKMTAGVTRYIPLRNSRGTEDAEALEYVQLDVAGIETQIAMYERFVQESSAQAGKDAPGAVTQPVEQSGISRAWQFKTGQERILFLITRELGECFNRVLEFVSEALGAEKGSTKLEFNEDFASEVDQTKEVEFTDKALGIADRYELKTLRAELLKSFVGATCPELSEEARSKIDGECDKAVTKIADEDAAAPKTTKTGTSEAEQSADKSEEE